MIRFFRAAFPHDAVALLRCKLAWRRGGHAKREEVFARENARMAGVGVEREGQRRAITYDANSCMTMTVNPTHLVGILSHPCKRVLLIRHATINESLQSPKQVESRPALSGRSNAAE